MHRARRLWKSRADRPWLPACRMATAALTAALVAYGWSAEGDTPGKEPPTEETEAPAETIDPLSVNATCYVCHIPFVREEISRVHFAEKVTCIKCHGLSAAHANDEDVGATKPDIMYRRDRVDKMCSECHEAHDVPARDIIARFLERKLEDTAAVCTDCHGQHHIEEPAADETGEDEVPRP